MKAAAAPCWQDGRWEEPEAAKLHRRGAGAPGLSQLPWEWKIRRQQMQIAFSKKENEDLVTVLENKGEEAVQDDGDIQRRHLSFWVLSI